MHDGESPGNVAGGGEAGQGLGLHHVTGCLAMTAGRKPYWPAARISPLSKRRPPLPSLTVPPDRPPLGVRRFPLRRPREVPAGVPRRRPRDRLAPVHAAAGEAPADAAAVPLADPAPSAAATAAAHCCSAATARAGLRQHSQSQVREKCGIHLNVAGMCKHPLLQWRVLGNREAGGTSLPAPSPPPVYFQFL